MPTTTRWSFQKITAWAVIGGTKVDIVGFQLTWPLNGLPTGQVQLPVGVGQNAAVAAIHSLVNKLNIQTPIQIFCKLAAVDGSDSGVKTFGLPSGKSILLFSGLTASGSYSRDRQSARYVIAVNHLLVRLNQASALSNSSHPGNPADFTYGALMGRMNQTGLSTRNWTAITGADTTVTVANLAQDVWGSAFYPWLLSMTQQDGIWLNQRTLQGNPSNNQATPAIQLLKPGGPGYVPFNLQPGITADEDLAGLIAKDITRATSDPTFTANQTLWDILVGTICADYMMAVVPTAAGGLVIPYAPCSRAPKPITISAGEYDHIDMQGETPRPLRAMAILSGINSDTNFIDPTTGAVIEGIGGWYDVPTDGYVRIDRGPPWTAKLLSASLYAAESSGANGKPIANAQNPKAGKANGAGAAAVNRAKNTIKPLLDSYAKFRFAVEVFKGRFGVVSGPFRLDIVPGALVQIEGAAEGFLGSADKLAQLYYGEVQAVSVALDAESGIAGTALHLGYVRSSAEQNNSALTLSQHPLYTKSFQPSAVTLFSSS